MSCSESPSSRVRDMTLQGRKAIEEPTAGAADSPLCVNGSVRGVMHVAKADALRTSANAVWPTIVKPTN